jgi:hypothetical protein
MLAQEEKEFILKAKIQVPPQYQEQYEGLILKNHCVF